MDTHKKAPVLVAIDTAGRTHGRRTVATTPAGWAAALRWVRGQPQQQVRWGVANRGSRGKGCARFLLAQGEADVREGVPQRTAQWRRRGRSQEKTDVADALALARRRRAAGEGRPMVQADDARTALRRRLATSSVTPACT